MSRTRYLALILASTCSCGEGRPDEVSLEPGRDTSEDALMIDPSLMNELGLAGFSGAGVPAFLLGRSVVAIIDSGLLDANNTLRTFPLSLCPGEKFNGSDRLLISPEGGCTASYLGGRIFLTARHCFNDPSGDPVPLSNLRVVFNYRVPAPYSNTRADVTMEADDIYTPTVITAEGDNEQGLDWALFAVDRPVSWHYRPLRVGVDPKVNDNLDLIGYPVMMGVKYSKGGKVWTSSGGHFRLPIDAMGGHSGGPFFNPTTHEIAGVLRYGPDDYTRDTTLNCNRWNTCSDCSMGGVGATDFKSAVVVQGPTCAGACNGRSPDGCWCDSHCHAFGDCCADADNCEAYWTPGLASCAAFCGSGSATGNCWCDAACAAYGDCCSDFYETCGRW